MMPDLQEIYDAGFFHTWGRRNVDYVTSAERITDILYDFFKPATLIDWGAGSGAHSFFFQEKGVCVTSIDGAVPPETDRFPVAIKQTDLTIPLDEKLEDADLSICFDVAEHIPETFRDTFLANITKHSRLLLLSCAPPRQGGHYHVNEQPKRYWISALRSLGFLYNRQKTGLLVEIFKSARPRIPYGWMYQHISVYEAVR